MSTQERNQDVDVDQVIEDGKHAETTALQYADWLVSTLNSAIPDENWVILVHIVSIMLLTQTMVTIMIL